MEDLASTSVGVLGLDLALWKVGVVLFLTVLGGAAQSALGFGAAFTTVPALALLAPRLLPGALIVAVVPLSVAMILRQRQGLDYRAVGRITLGRLPGIVVGALVVAALDVRALTVLVAVLLLLAVMAAVRGWELEVTGPREVVAGAVSGMTGTAAGLGGPPLAMLYRNKTGEMLRPTLASVWLVGSPLSLTALALVGSLTRPQVQAGIVMAGATLVGLTLAAPFVLRMEDRTLRSLILAWAAVGSVAALVRAFSGA